MSQRKKEKKDTKMTKKKMWEKVHLMVLDNSMRFLICSFVWYYHIVIWWQPSVWIQLDFFIYEKILPTHTHTTMAKKMAVITQQQNMKNCFLDISQHCKKDIHYLANIKDHDGM